MAKISALGLARKEEVPRRSAEELRQEAHRQLRGLLELAEELGKVETKFGGFETALAAHVAALARTVVVLFLVIAEERVTAALGPVVERKGRLFWRGQPQDRALMSRFGVVRYWRLYMRAAEEPATGRRQGFHPLDVALGLVADRIVPSQLAVAVRLALRMSFAEAREIHSWFVPTVPSTEVVEAATIGYGKYAAKWLDEAPIPQDDGNVLIVHIDSGGVPTATLAELTKRRGKRKKRQRPKSQRHRGRQNRHRWGPKTRRAPGDKSKNAKMATAVVMYTLRRTRGGRLEGPINKWVYATFQAKRVAVKWARAQATRRGFPPSTRRIVQLLTDGDAHLEEYIAEYFPDAIHTPDIVHVIEKLWDAGNSLFSVRAERERWVQAQKDALYDDRAHDIVAELRRHHDAVARTGPGTKQRRETLSDVLNYIEKRAARMNYGELMARDLEVSTGPGEGAIRALLRRRMDYGSMRWIRERAEMLLQLRCIDANGHWEAFIAHVHQQIDEEAMRDGTRIRLQKRQPDPLPIVAEAA